MNYRTLLIPLAGLFALIAVHFSVAAPPDVPAPAAPKPLQVLIITGGCCHDYKFQAAAMMEGIAALTPVEFQLVHEGGNGTKAELPLYDDPAWAKPYDVVIHNECFADTADEAYIQKIVKAHAGGVPAVVVHCAMHTYRASGSDLWREFLGVTSRHHEHQSRYPVAVASPEHPIMAGFPADWKTPMDELYIIEKVWPGAKVLATSVSEKTGSVQPVMWTNDYRGTRVVGTTYGHTNDTFKDPVFLKFLARGVVWAAGRPWKE